jgi:hypothetical protein
MTVTWRTLQVMSLVLLCVPGAAAQDFPGDGRWVPLVNGRDLDGWTPKIRGYEAGTISLQSESHPIEFRTVEIMALKE